MTFLLGGGGPPVMAAALQKLIQKADRLSIAVSYIQVSGWEKLASFLPEKHFPTLRILCDDCSGITNPQAVRRILDRGVQIRAFDGNVIYHPKVFIAHRHGSVANDVLIGSANLSEPALLRSVEGGIRAEDEAGELSLWFDDLFENQSAVFDEQRLQHLETAFNRRIKYALAGRRAAPRPHQPAQDAEGKSLVDEIFSGLGDYIAPLSFDQGKNNVRNLAKARELTQSNSATWSNVQVSELRFSGLADGRILTALGQNVAQAPTLQAAVALWGVWFKHTLPQQLPTRKYKNLEVAQRAYGNFWSLKREVRDFFLEHAVQNNAVDKPVLQAIELIANSGSIGTNLTLGEIRVLSPLLTEPSRFPANVADVVRTYIDNKASRTWGIPERKWILEAWRDA